MTSRAFNQDTGRAKKAAVQGPVIITDRGEPTYVLLSIEDYRRLADRPVTLFEALAGRPVFDEEDREALFRRVLLDPAPRVRSLRADVPAECAAIIDRLLEKEPERRYPSAAVLAEDLRRSLAGESRREHHPSC